MLKALIGTAAAATIAVSAFSFAAPAQAAEFGVYAGPGYHHSCRHWSERLQSWVWTCNRPYGYYDRGPTFGFEFGDRDRYHDFDRHY